MQPQSPNREQEVPKNGVPNGGAPFSNRIVQTDVDVSLRSSTLQQTAGVELQTKPNTVEGNNR